MRRICGLIAAGGLWAGIALAQSPVTVTIDTHAPGAEIPADFAGLSFGMRALLPGQDGALFFSATNRPLVTLFQNAGLRHLRVGGTTVESPPETAIPGFTEIDNLFAFAHDASVNKIIYSLRLLETDPAHPYAATNAALAQHIWNHHRSALECFAIGNEPDRRTIFDQDLTITNFATYMVRWKKFAADIDTVAPGAKFAGPDGGSGNTSWTTRFAEAEKNSGLIAVIAEHYYSGGKGKGLTPAQGIDSMLSPDLAGAYQKLYNKMAAVVLSNGLPYRFTEANDHYSGGVPGASDTFAGALWSLDFLHWWAAHGAAGVDFHNTEWVASDIIAPDANGTLAINPKGYGVKAFDLGGHGRIQSVAMTNADGVNLAAYAVRDNRDLFLTLINREHGAGARAAAVTIQSDGIWHRAQAILLTAANGDAAAKTGVTLGGAAIGNVIPWQGKWTPLPEAKAGPLVVTLAPTSAMILKIAAK